MILVIWPKGAGRTSGIYQRFLAEAGKNQFLKDVTKGQWGGGVRVKLLRLCCPQLPPPLHWVSLAQKSSHTSFPIRPLMTHRQCLNPGQWNYSSLLREFLPWLLLKIGKDVSWHLEHDNRSLCPQSVTSNLKCLTLLSISTSTCWICFIAGKIQTS